MQSRWKSKVMWAGVASTLLLLAGQLGLYDAIGITQDVFQNVVTAILTLLAGFGVLNNPTSSDSF